MLVTGAWPVVPSLPSGFESMGLIGVIGPGQDDPTPFLSLPPDYFTIFVPVLLPRRYLSGVNALI